MNPDSPSTRLAALQQALSKLQDSSPSETTPILNQARQLLEEVSHILESNTAYLSFIAHELRIPMTAIMGYTDLLRQGTVGLVNQQQREFLSIIRANVERMAALVSYLSDLSRLTMGQLKLNPGVIAIGEALETALQNLKGQFQAKKQAVHVHTILNTPRLYADPQRVVQVLMILLSNANKYTPAGGEIHLRVRPHGKSMRLLVSDNGCGIRPEDQPHIFEPFYRSEEPAVREQSGWGLGLSLAKGLVESMGGEIGVESQLGQGSTFWFTLPCEDKDEDA